MLHPVHFGMPLLKYILLFYSCQPLLPLMLYVLFAIPSNNFNFFQMIVTISVMIMFIRYQYD